MIIQSVLKTLRSLKVTVVLIICLASVFGLGLIIPQKNLLGREMYPAWKAEKPGLVAFLEAIDFTEIYTSPVTFILWGLFFLNLMLVMINRIPAIWKRTVKKDLTVSVESIKTGRHYEIIEGENIDSLSSAFARRGYRFFSDAGSFRAIKNRFSPLATILFHFSFFLLLIGAIMTFYTKFRAEASVAVGETFTGQYHRVRPPKIGSIPETTFTVTAINPTYYKKTLSTDLKVVLQTKKGEEIMGINKPYREGALSFIVSDIDIAPLFIIKDKSGKEVEGAYVKLKVLRGEEDSFRMLGYDFRTIFYTDYSDEIKNKLEKTTALPQILRQLPMNRRVPQPGEVINPAFKILIFKDGLFVKEQTIKKGAYIEFEGYSLIFEDLNYWATFYVGKEHGLNILYTGFTFMVLALIIRFLFYRRDIKGVIERDRIHIGGKGEFYPALFGDEFRKMMDDLKS